MNQGHDHHKCWGPRVHYPRHFSFLSSLLFYYFCLFLSLSFFLFLFLLLVFAYFFIFLSLFILCYFKLLSGYTSEWPQWPIDTRFGGKGGEGMWNLTLKLFLRVFISFPNINKNVHFFGKFFRTLVQASLSGSPSVPLFDLFKFCKHGLIFGIAGLTSVHCRALRALRTGLAPTGGRSK